MGELILAGSATPAISTVLAAVEVGPTWTGAPSH